MDTCLSMTTSANIVIQSIELLNDRDLNTACELNYFMLLKCYPRAKCLKHASMMNALIMI